MSRFLANSILKNFALLTLVAGFATESAWARKLSCQQVPELMTISLARHYTYKQLTDEIKERTVHKFIKGLDPSKTSLLEADVTKLKGEVPKLFETMNSGGCAAFDEVYKLQVERQKATTELVKRTLGPTYKIDESVEFVMSPDKRGYAKTQEEKDKLLVSMIHFQIMNLLVSDTTLEKAKKQLLQRYEVVLKRVTEHKAEDLITDFAEAFAQALDPHSSYLSQDDMEDFQIQMNLSLEGIGVSLSSEDGYITVQEILPGGSADRAKLLAPKDKITAVGQDSKATVSVIDMDLRDVVKLIRGKKGTKVKLTVLRETPDAKNFEVTLVRDKIDIKEQAARIAYETKKVGKRKVKIGILDLPSFYGGQEGGARSSYRDVKGLLEDARKEKVDGLILDLSRNGGGLLQDAVKIAGLFLQQGPVVAMQNRQQGKEVLADTDSETVYGGPLLILTSRVSASASEIVAGALKDYRRAVIVGADHTFGKGTVQEFAPLPMKLGALKLTLGMYFVPKGGSTQHQGVVSDIPFPSILNTEDVGEKTLEYSLPNASIPNFAGTEANSADKESHWTEVDDALVQKLLAKSKARVAKDPEFIEIQKEIADSEKSKGVIKLADMKKKSDAEKKKGKGKKDKDKYDTVEKRLRQHLETPQIKEATRIMTDWITG